MEEGEGEGVELGLPDELRCRRSDGKQWRCKRRVVGDLKNCEYHVTRSRTVERGRAEKVKIKKLMEKKEVKIEMMLVEEQDQTDSDLPCFESIRRKWSEEKVAVVEEAGVLEIGEGGGGERRVDVGVEIVEKDGGESVSLPVSIPASGWKRKCIKKNGDERGNEKLGDEGIERREIVLGLEVVKKDGVEGVTLTASGRKRKIIKRYGDEVNEGYDCGSKTKQGKKMKKKKMGKEKEGEVQVVRRVTGARELVPDHLRCTRTDGKQWRCYRKIQDGENMCEAHIMQGRLRGIRAKVPESLKLQRGDRNSLFTCSTSQLQVPKIGVGKKRRPLKWRQWSKCSETLDDALKKLQLRKSDMELQLLRAYLKRRAEKLEMQQHFATEGSCHKEVKKDLPFGAMTISASPAFQAANRAGTPFNLKIGFDPDSLSGVSFRSKNIEPLPNFSMKVMPSVNEMARLKKAKRRCHLCKTLGSHLTRCSSCKKELFCMDCIKERYFTSQEDVEKSCPVCCKDCCCESCLEYQSEKDLHQNNENDDKRFIRIRDIRQLIHYLYPILEHLKREQMIELELEAKVKGKEQSEICIQQVGNCCSEQLYCKNCKNCILDFHRSCKDCSYSLCLNCSHDLSEGFAKGMGVLLSRYFDRTKNKKRFSHELLSPLSSPYWKFGVYDGSICCPAGKLGGCGGGLLVLNRVFPPKWIDDLKASAANVIYRDGYLDDLTFRDVAHGSETVNQVQQAASRQNSDDNYLYYPSINECDGHHLDEFHKHWQRHHPIIVRNVLQHTSDLCWDPIFIFCTYLERCSVSSPDCDEVEASNCLNWCEVEIGIRQSFMGPPEGWNRVSLWNETLKLRGALSSHLFQNKFPDHCAKILRCLPYKEYMNPVDGISNLAVNLPLEVSKPDLGPYVHISYGSDLESADFIEKLCYNSYDSVHILVHATDITISSEEVSKVRKLMEKKWSQYQEASTRLNHTVTTQKRKEKSLMSGANVKEADLLTKQGERLVTCDGESGGSCNSVVVNEASLKSVDALNSHYRESGSDSEASNICSKSDDQTAVLIFNNRDCVNNSPSTSCGAEWDVFRRQDIPGLIDYLKRHSDHFRETANTAQPIGQNFFLDSAHKSRLKDVFNIEPWTFQQRVGEDVIIPAGCPYQRRTLKSSVSVVFDFVSPESARDSIHLSDELTLLPEDHVSNQDKLEVKKMALYNISSAIQQLSELNTTGYGTFRKGNS